ncbi:MAG: cytochrome c peroxidase [Planctomycetota bacterium]
MPQHFTTPQIAALDNTPVDNPITNAGAELGRVLFYDARLSHNNGVACASCHTQETGFSDPNQFSTGVNGVTGRQSPGLSNAKFYVNRESGTGHFFWDERANTLEDQVLGPIQDPVEMGSTLSSLVDELNATDYYPTLFNRAFGAGGVTSDRMSKALAQFVRAMASYQSPFDAAIAAGTQQAPNFAAVDAIDDPVQVSQGHTLFNDDCASCHRTAAQVSDNTHNIGLPNIDADGDGQLDDNTGTGGGASSNPDAGSGEYKSPSLRNIAMRGHFMHDGRFSTLEEVVEFYSSGITPNGHPLSRGARNGGFGYTEAEKAALVAFMETLTDTTFLTSELFSNPLVTLAGDYDGSGVVDDEDLASWQAEYGMTDADVDGPLYADGNGDGRVDSTDYTLWRDNYGATWDTSGIAALAQAVPEPAGLGIVTAALALLRRPRRPRSS